MFSGNECSDKLNQNYSSILQPKLNDINDNIVINDPNNVTSWERGTSQYIIWSTTGNISYVIIELWRANAPLYTITSKTENDQAKYWEIPANQQSDIDYQIKIIDYDNLSIFVFSDKFEIYQSPDIWIITPHSASKWKADSSQIITWDTSGRLFVSYVDIELYFGVEPVLSIVNRTLNDGTYLWYLPYDPLPSNLWSIKITDSYNSSIYGISDNFQIYTDKSITILKPIGFRHWGAPDNHLISWTSNGNIEKVNIEISLNGGIIYTINNTENDGVYDWAIPNNISASIFWRIKIFASDYIHVYDISDNFEIFIIKTIILVYPNSSVIWESGSYYDLQWISTGNTTEVVIELYKNDEYYLTITSRTQNDGRYLYKPTGDFDASAEYKIKISAFEDNSVFDFSDESFKFKEPEKFPFGLIIISTIIAGNVVGVIIPLGLRFIKKRKSKREQQTKI